MKIKTKEMSMWYVYFNQSNNIDWEGLTFDWKSSRDVTEPTITFLTHNLHWHVEASVLVLVR